MQVKIQRSVTLILAITLLASYALMTLFVYNQNLDMLRDNVRYEARYIAFLVSSIEGGAWEKIYETSDLARVTHISEEGYILFDTSPKVDLLLRLDREEVEQAFMDGSGESTRVSYTLGERVFNYAILLDDGTVIRVSQTVESLIHLALRFLPIMLGIYLVMTLCTWILLRWKITSLIKPINELDLERPLENKAYDELKPLLKAIEKKNTEHSYISEMRKEFSANVSHELKTPLTSISGYAEIIMNGIARPGDIPEFSERIFKEAKRLLALIDDTIRLSRLDESRIESVKEELDLYELCFEVVGRLNSHAEKKNVQMILTGEPVSYLGIKHLIDEMIYNLCDNAIKYNHIGGKVDVWVGETNDGILVRVSDTGIGISSEHYERIFERFYRVDKSHSRETGGTGLGLSIVKHVAALHEARIEVESTIGKGTKIEVWF